MLILAVTAAIVVALLLTVVFGSVMWRLARGHHSSDDAPSGDRTTDREFRKIAKRIGRLEPPSED